MVGSVVGSVVVRSVVVRSVVGSVVVGSVVEEQAEGSHLDDVTLFQHRCGTGDGGRPRTHQRCVRGAHAIAHNDCAVTSYPGPVDK